MMCQRKVQFQPEAVPCPLPIDPELSPLAVLAVNSLRETYKHRGPEAFDEAALILLMVVGSIIARTRGPEGLNDAMEALRLAVEESPDGSGDAPSPTTN
jgi:hypothetical protein